MLRLRGHHLLCIPRFRGLGYDGDFTANLARVAEHLRMLPSQVVCVTEEADDICSFCPHLDGSACMLCGDDGDVAERDRRVLSLLQLAPGTCLPYSELQAQLAKRSSDICLSDICAGCRWLGACLTFPEA